MKLASKSRGNFAEAVEAAEAEDSIANEIDSAGVAVREAAAETARPAKMNK
jgi:hypothetical protein